MTLYELILKKRNGQELSKEEIEFIVKDYVDGKIPDYQIASLLMAIYFKKMTAKEATNLAMTMAYSGDMLDLSDINGITVDKHSTGGVGDKVTLVLAPMLAACGAKIAKMSGRGLGHTGGTIDKLESIPGFNTTQEPDYFKKQVNEIGISVIGQSLNIAPADKKLYALRDVTATVDSIPLIASSIMSKKLASGAQCICLDVKVGSGAFMKDLKEAEKLAKLMIKIGKLAGRKVSAVLTNMDEPLGKNVGNLLEVEEALENLKGNITSDLMEVCLTIGSILLKQSLGISEEKAREKLLESIHNGQALEKFKQMVQYQQGDVNVLDNISNLIDCQTYSLKALRSGYVSKFNTLNLGEAARILGAGRLTKEDVLDMRVGFEMKAKIGTYVNEGDEIVKIYHSNQGLEQCIEILQKSIAISDNKPESVVLIEKILK